MTLEGIASGQRIAVGGRANGFDVDQLAKLKHSVSTVYRRVEVRAREGDSAGEEVPRLAAVYN